MKKNVFWGIGNICRAYLDNDNNIIPEFFIDSNYYGERFYGKPVFSPDVIDDWSQLFIIIMCKMNGDIVDFLKEKGLNLKTDFVTYDMLCNNKKITYNESLMVCRDLMSRSHYDNLTLLFLPIFNMRSNKTMFHFIDAYQRAHKCEQYIIFTDRDGVDATGTIKKYAWTVIDLPVLAHWFETDEYRNVLKKELAEFSKGKVNYEKIEEIIRKKDTQDINNTRECLMLMYEYYGKLFEIMKPKRMVVWGGWDYRCYILGQLASERKIPVRFMEYGWIPGTYQLDRRGIQGQGEYAVDSKRLLNTVVLEKEIKQVKMLKTFILSSKKDTVVSHETITDDESLSKLNPDKKTVFVAGMDDAGMKMNPKSDYWYHYVSHCFQSTKEMLIFIYDICRRNDWNLIFKPHPRHNKGNLFDITDIGSDIIFILDRDVDSLIQIADVTVCMASAVEYKVLMYGKPLVSVGRSAIQGKKCAYEVKNKNEIETVMREAVNKGMAKAQETNFDIHLAQLLKTSHWDDLSEKDIRYGLPVACNFFEEA